MKRGNKCIIAAIMTIAIFAALLPVGVYATTVEIVLDTEYECGEGDNAFTFTPEETGIYTFTNVSYDETGKYSLSFGVENSIYFDDASESVTYPQENYCVNTQNISYLLFSGETYDITINWTPLSSFDTWNIFTLTFEPVTMLGELKVGEDATGKNAQDNGYLKFVPEKSGIVLAYGWEKICDITERETGWYREFGVAAGGEYWLFVENGDYMVTCEYIPETDNAAVITSNISDMQSTHPYAYGLDKSRTYNAEEGTVYSDITFNDKTYIDRGDYIYIYDGNGTEIGTYSQGSLAGQTVSLAGDSFTIRLVSDAIATAYGYALDRITSYKSVPKPTADTESGTVRPTDVTLSAASAAADIYYKVTTAETEGTFQKYTAAVEITEDCTLSAYAQIGNSVSETVTYEYTVNTAELSAPVFTLAQDGYVTLSAKEGTIYYKLLTSKSFSEYTDSKKLYVNSGKNVLAAYAKSGNLESEIVYYSYENNVDDGTEYALSSPIFTVTDVLGGKQLTISVPEGHKLYDYRDYYYNYQPPHFGGTCTHEPFEWWYGMEESYIYCTVGGASVWEEKQCSDNSNTPLTFVLTENTVAKAGLKVFDERAMGYYIEFDGMCMPEMSGTNIDDSQYSEEVYRYIEVPKTEKPTVSMIGTAVTITAAENAEIYYSINGGEYAKYTVPFNADGGDRISAYAVGIGTTTSDITQKNVPVMSGCGMAVKNDLILNAEGGIDGLSVRVTNNTPASQTCTVAAAVFDGDNFCGISLKPVSVSGKTTLTVSDFGLTAGDVENASVKLFLWEGIDNMIPKVNSKTISVK